MSPDPLTVLSTLASQSSAELQPSFLQLEEQWDRKLWYQLTETVLALFRHPESAEVRLPLFTQFVAPLRDLLNPLAYVTLAIEASGRCGGLREALEFLTQLAAEVDSEKTQAEHLYVRLHIAKIHLKLGDNLVARKIIDAGHKQLDCLYTSENVVRAALHGVECEFYKVKGDYSNYYKCALQYLSSIDFDQLDKTVKQQKAHDLAIAALVGQTTYNFGELILHPILDSLDGDYAWLKELVLAVNGGDMIKFHSLLPELSKSPVLEASLTFLNQKICLTSFTECVFRRPTADRVLSFDTIARETQLHTGSKVEVMVLKAFSIGLAKGHIDQADRTVTITWLQPRVLDRQQMLHMRERLRSWDNDVQQLGKFMLQEGEGVYASAR